jgi:hypothetical protein
MKKRKKWFKRELFTPFIHCTNCRTMPVVCTRWHILRSLWVSYVHLEPRIEAKLFTVDILEYLVSYAKLSGDSVRHHLLYIIHSFFSKGIFHVLPPSTLRSYNPTILPHSFVTPVSDPAPTHSRGGRTKAEKDRAGRAKWQQLNEWVESRPTKYSPIPQATEYHEAKKATVEVLPGDLEKRAEQSALARLKGLAKDATGPSEGVDTFENMLQQGRGILRNQWDQSDI